MTRLAKRLSLVGLGILLTAGWATAGELRTPSYRPYIVEVGPPRTISRQQLDKEMYLNSDLRSWIRNYGYPDVAEIQAVVPEYGWSDYEIRTYYLDRDQELAFGRIAFMPYQGDPGFLDDYGLVKYQGKIQPEGRQRIQSLARIGGCGGDTSLDRILAAAERAERASTMAEKESLRAMQSAEKAEAAASRIETRFNQSLHKK
jgi:hypothetical protein